MAKKTTSEKEIKLEEIIKEYDLQKIRKPRP
jgi:hypothetical protein